MRMSEEQVAELLAAFRQAPGSLQHSSGKLEVDSVAIFEEGNEGESALIIYYDR